MRREKQESASQSASGQNVRIHVRTGIALRAPGRPERRKVKDHQKRKRHSYWLGCYWE